MLLYHFPFRFHKTIDHATYQSLTGQTPKIRSIKPLIPGVSFHKHEMAVFLAIFHLSHSSYLAKIVVAMADHGADKTDALFFKAENRFINIFHANR